MEALAYLLVALLLLLLNAFFVLAEFAAVKLRPSRVEELIDRGVARARLVQRIQGRLDEYLAVCQLGITFASIGIGIVGELGAARLVEDIAGVSTGLSHTIAVTVMFVLVSALHVVIGEQVPKIFAIRRPAGSLLAVALPLRFFRMIFYGPLLILNNAATGVLWLLGIRGKPREKVHSEEELKIILEQSQTKGLISFRRLLFLENIFDLGDLKVRDAMRLRQGIKVLRTNASWEENLKVIRESRYSRHPLVEHEGQMPLGVVHVKDLFYAGAESLQELDLRTIARPHLVTTEEMPLETLLGELQRHRGQLAMVKDAKGNWSGLIAMEDIVEEIVGTIEDEFEIEPPLFLADGLTAGRIVFGVRAGTLEEAIEKIFARIPEAEFPCPREKAARAVLDREKAMSTYLGKGLAVPHARLEGLTKPMLIYGRSGEGVPVKSGNERAHLIFILLTPLGMTRVQARLLARIATLLESEFTVDRLREAAEPADVLEAIRAADPATIS